ncbi:MAG: DUF4923 family protein [Tidjanibacter sp.]|nr:DUF4923 family protein [Tidjanibacter sp.]
MKKFHILLISLIVGSLSAHAQFNLSSLVNKAKEAVSEAAGEVLPEEVQDLLGITLPKVEIPGTWSYVDVAVEFVSENALTNAGGVVAAETVKSKLSPMLTKVGIKEGAFSFTFLEDGTLTTTLAQKTVKGTWAYDEKSKSVTLGLSGKEFTTRMTVNQGNINILFKADKLLELIKTVSSTSSNTTLATIGAVAKAYDGMNLGFECRKVE